jgi:RNA polymerase sigma-70 factor (ECF subfamily)
MSRPRPRLCFTAARRPPRDGAELAHPAPTPEASRAVADGARTSSDLMGRLRDVNDGQAWQTFWQQYVPKVRAWAEQAGLPPGDVEEVVSMVLVRLVKAMPGFEYNPGLSFRAWLRSVVRSAVGDLWRARARSPGAQGAGGSGILTLIHAVEDHAGAEPLVEELNGELERQRQALRQAIDRVRGRVAAHTWDAFWLRVAEQRRGEVVAERLGMKVAAVYVAQNRVTGMLREELAELGFPSS